LALVAEYGTDGISTTVPDDDFTFAILIAGISAVAAIFFLICWLYVSTEIAAIDLSHLPSPPTTRPLIFSAMASLNLCNRTNAFL
jgi:hypothetical protein